MGLSISSQRTFVSERKRKGGGEGGREVLMLFLTFDRPFTFIHVD